jgi:hypothetical protein
LIFSHGGRPFDEDDIKSLCSVGNSTKINKQRTTRYKGIGFKSVFHQSNLVYIVSDGYYFRFDKKFSENPSNWKKNEGLNSENIDNHKIPWQICPIWTDKNEIDQTFWSSFNRFNVNIIIYFKNNTCFEECRTTIYENERDHMYFLFLQSKSIVITILENSILKAQYRKMCREKENVTTIYNNDTIIGHYFFHTFELQTNTIFTDKQISDFKRDLNFPQKLAYTEELALSFACELVKKEDKFTVKLLPEHKRLIYSYLPTKVNFNFPFLINTNFILDAGKAQLKEDLWNYNLFSQMPSYIELFLDEVLQNFGNSFSLTLPFNIKLDKCFNSHFYDNMKKSIEEKKSKLKILTKSKKNFKLFTDCYINNFSLCLPKQNNKSVTTFFQHIYGESGKEICADYFFNNKVIKIDEDNEIACEDLSFIEDIQKYYDLQAKQSLMKT